MGKGGGSHPAKALEPVKAAEQVQKGAAASTIRAQQLRMGLASTFSRSTMGGGVSGTATSGASKKLGG